MDARTVRNCHSWQGEKRARRIETDASDGTKLIGWLEKLQWNRRQNTLEVTCRLSGESGSIWVDSANLAEVGVWCGEQHKVFLFHQQKEVKESHIPSHRDYQRDELNQVRVLNEWFIGLMFLGLLSIAASNVFRGMRNSGNE